MNKKISKYIFVVSLIVLSYFTFKYVNVQIRKARDERDRLAINKFDSLDCECSKVRARKNIKLGNLMVIYNPKNPYLEELAFNDYGIYVQPYGFRTCGDEIMDSVIYKRYGKDFFKNLEKKADSIKLIKPWKGISLDVYFDKRGIYKCKDIYKLIKDSLTEKGLLPVEQNKCLPGELVIDFVITEEGKLTNFRRLIKFDSIIDTCVINLLKKAPCQWEPAEDGGKKVSCRKQLYFSFRESPQSMPIE